MILRAPLIGILALALSACGHLPASSPAVPVPPYAETSEGSQATPAAVDTAQQNDENIEQNDLLARIRAGFAFPKFNDKYILQYEKWNSEHPTYLAAMFARAEPFLFYIVEELEKRNMPMELALLPAVESAFKPTAVSRSRAAGLWQFVPATGRHYGLRQDWWYDGRLDAIAATTAALDYLQHLNGLFGGDWQVTLAAYNGGQGTVRRAIKANQRRGRGIRFQDLRLRKETEQYVPKLYALRNIIMNPEKFSVALPVIPNEPHFSILELPRQADIKQLISEAGLDLAQMQHLNASYRRWATPPEGPHRLLIPLNNLAKVKYALSSLDSTPAVTYLDYAIRNGDTLSSIARDHGVSVAGLKSVNSLRGSRITAGKTLLIPVPADRNAPDQAVANAPQAPAASDTPVDANREIIHRVARGDTLWSIAKRYQVQVSQLLSWNKLSINGILSLDQPVRVFTY